jgi:hypothetical protein
MGKELSNRNLSRKSALTRILPEKRSLGDMQDIVDILLLKSLRRIEVIIGDDSEEIAARDHVAAANTVVNIGKYIHQRIVSEQAKEDDIIEIDDDLMIKL